MFFWVGTGQFDIAGTEQWRVYGLHTISYMQKPAEEPEAGLHFSPMHWVSVLWCFF